ncbi:MAG: hypothetical protein KAS23_16995, partial [Anaerohalosphaera sp.]|nr:hypothetical protein [Anaerohalosphaera sp.]
DKLKFARRALTDHRDQRPSEFSQCDKILAFKGDEGWKEFFDSSLSFYEKYSKNMRVAVNAPLAMRYFMISTVENSIFDDFDTFEEKYEKLPDDYVPTKEDYDDFIKDCGVGFPMFNGAPMGVIYYIEMSSITKRNALLVGVSLKLEYLKTGKLPDGVPVGSPKDAFGEQAFDLIKTEEGFKIKSRSYNVATNEQPEYEFKLGKSSTPGKIEYSGGDGSSMAEAVVITGAIDSMAGVRAERTWIEINHPGWKRSMQSLIQSGKKAYDVNEYTTESGETKTICFDITDFFGKY